MTIQRQYSLPNCKLILEGVSGDSPLDPMSARPLVSMVTNVECHISGYDYPLVGGRDFLDSLVRTVSEYAQEYLSGMPHALAHRNRHHHQLVQLRRVDKNLHRLTVEPQVDGGAQPNPNPAQLDLTTVQLFDLVEAVDQFFADAQTLPELALNLTSLPRRFAQAKEPPAQRVIPALLGISGVAVAALALFFVPIPERRPQPSSGSTTQESPVAATTPGASPDRASSPTPTATSSPTTSSSTSPVAVVSPSASASPSSESTTVTSATASPSTSASTSTATSNGDEIADPAVLERLQVSLYDKLDRGWNEKAKTTPPTFSEDLIYRVSVSPNGEIRGYKPINDAATTHLNEVPLADTQFARSSGASTDTDSSSAASSTSGSIAEFRAVFKPDGVLEVSPWYGGEVTDPSSSATPSQSP